MYKRQALVKALNFERNAIRGFESRNLGLAASTRRVGFLSSLVERSSTAEMCIRDSQQTLKSTPDLFAAVRIATARLVGA